MEEKLGTELAGWHAAPVGNRFDTRKSGLLGFHSESEHRRGVARCIAVAVLSGPLGCSLLVDVGREQCSTNLDCQSVGLSQAVCIDNLCQIDPKWACVDDTPPPAVQAAVDASVQVINRLNRTPYVGVHASLYSGSDISLATPLASGDTNAEGYALLNVPAGFDGFVLVEQPGFIEPSIFYPTLPISAQSGIGTVVAGQPGASADLVNLLGQVPQVRSGIALMTVRDCNGTGGGGASFNFQGETQGSTPFYTFNGVSSPIAQTLDDTGQAGIVNVEPGVVGLDLRWGERTVSSANVLVRADTVTHVTFLPGRLNAVGAPPVRSSWSCLNTLDAPGVDTYSTDATGSSVTLRVPLHDFTTKQNVASASARLCWAVDVSCQTPLINWTSIGEDGIFSTVAPWGFAGYMEVIASGYLPLVIPIDTPLYRDLELYSTGLLPIASHQALQAATGITFGPADGLLYVNANDCWGAYASGVSVSATGDGLPFSFSGGVPAPGSTVTTGDGLVAFPRTREGIVQVNGTVGGQLMDSQAVIVRGGGVTVVTLRPVIYDRSQICPDGRDAQTCVVRQ